MDRSTKERYIAVLERELVPAMGCTEPIAVAYAAALARDTLGVMPEKVELLVCGSIIKNAKSVVVPNTDGRKGLTVAAAAGIVFGNAESKLEVIAGASPDRLPGIDDFLSSAEVTLHDLDTKKMFDLTVRVYAGQSSAEVRIADRHTNVVLIKKDGVTVSAGDDSSLPEADDADDGLNIKDIVEFADTVDIEAIRPVLTRQINCNMAIAEAGITGKWGAGIGSILLSSYGDTVWNRAKAYAAAGSDARMNGCELPVIINSGSGNQGMTASIPVIVYARDQGCDDETLLRALAVSNLVTIHLKSGIGSLSAYCGATSAGVGAGAGICYLFGGRFDRIAHTVVNALAIDSGMICDGAKSSCAAKIASAVEAGLLGFQMSRQNSEFVGGDGIVIKGVENTIRAVSRVARNGMESTNEEIIRIMTGQ